jgi:diguanylate cyclase (GGDEF)-like protein/PAS domain S-box-containing protein
MWSTLCVDVGQVRLWLRVLAVRNAAIVALAVAALLVPGIGPNRHWVALAVVVFVLPYNLLLQHRLRREGRLDRFMPYVDLLLAAAFPLLAGRTWAPALLVGLADVALAVVAFGRAAAVRASVLGVAAFAVAGLALDETPIDPLVGVTGFAIAAGMVVATVGFAAAEERESRHRFARLVNNLDAIVWEWDPVERRLTFVSRQVEQILGWTVEEWARPGFWRDHLHVDDREAATNRFQRAVDEARDAVSEYRMLARDGRIVWLRDLITVRRSPDGSPASVRGVTVDVTAEHESAVRLRQYADIVDNMQVALAVWHLPDPADTSSLRVVDVNPAAEAQFGFRREDVVGRSAAEAFPQLADTTFAEVVAGTIRTGRHVTLDSVPYRHPDGRRGVFSVRVFPLPGATAGVAAEDDTERSRAEDALRHQALHDPLTGLPNRALLHDRLATSLSMARRTKQPVALLVMDLDQFKEINDTLGHLTGDLLLEQVAHRLTGLLRDCDTVSRLGGDEFAVLLTASADRRGAERVARRIEQALDEPFLLNGMAVASRASIGIVVSPEHGDDAETLLQRADVAMYAAKRAGRGHVVYAAEDDRSSVRRLALVGELRTALDEEQLVLHYQPQIDLRTGDVVGAEALVRWQHPTDGLLPPSEFIELAEVTGLIQPLTHWVIGEAVRQSARWRDEGLDLGVSVNVSARNLYDPLLAEGIRSALATAGVEPASLVLELTESQLVEDPSQVMAVLTLVSSMGVRLAIDDFGTGWSSLSNLTRLPIHQIKVDRSFVAGMLDGVDDAVIVRSIVDLGHNLGLVVVAEGVEDASVLAALRGLACDQAQGHWLSPAVPACDLSAWVRRRGAPEAAAADR